MKEHRIKIELYVQLEDNENPYDWVQDNIFQHYAVCSGETEVIYSKWFEE